MAMSAGLSVSRPMSSTDRLDAQRKLFVPSTMMLSPRTNHMRALTHASSTFLSMIASVFLRRTEPVSSIVNPAQPAAGGERACSRAR